MAEAVKAWNKGVVEAPAPKKAPKAAANVPSPKTAKKAPQKEPKASKKGPEAKASPSPTPAAKAAPKGKSTPKKFGSLTLKIDKVGVALLATLFHTAAKLLAQVAMSGEEHEVVLSSGGAVWDPKKAKKAAAKTEKKGKASK